MSYLRQSTATAVLIGPFIDDADGKTPETALTVTSFDADLYKHSNTHPRTKTDLTITASGGDNDCAHVANGVYSLELTAGNTDTLGRLKLTINITGALPVWHDFMVLPANEFDSLILGTDDLQVDAIQVSGTTQTARDLGASVLLSPGTGTGQISLSSGAVTAGTVGDKTGYGLSDSAITSAKFASDAISAGAIASAAANKIADHAIRRSFQNACDSSDGDSKTFRSLLGAIGKLVNKLSVSGSTLTIYEDDDTTALGTQTITTNAAAEPITALDTD